MKRIRILLADDHAVVRQGFKMILGAQADMEIVGEAGNGREAVQLAEELRPDVVVMDVAMPELNGIEATRRLAAVAAAYPRHRAQHAQGFGVRARDPARRRPRLPAEGLAGRRSRLCRAGGGVAARAISAPRSRTPCSTITAGTSPIPIDLLTSREREVLQMLAEGKTNKEIAVVLNLSVYTVDAHRGRIMEKLNLHSINELVRFAVRNGLID